MPERQSLQHDVFCAVQLDQMTQTHHFDVSRFQVQTGGRKEVKRTGLGVVEPLAGGVQFLKDVFHHAIGVVHPEAAVVLPAAFIRQRSVRIFAGDDVVKVAPLMAVHRMKIRAERIGPAGGSFTAESVGGVPVEVANGGIKIRVACHILTLPVHKKLSQRQAARNLRLPDTVAERFPG